MKRSIIHIGDSLGITLPKLILETFNVEVGDKGHIEVVENGFFIKFSKKGNEKGNGVSQ